MTDLTLKTENVPAVLSANFEEVRAALAARLQAYEVVVTADTVKDAKTLATELNKMAGELDKRRKEEVAKASAPVREFDDRMKELVGMCKEGRLKLIQQVEKFEDKTRELCLGLLKALRLELVEKHGVREEFQRAGFDDLVMISHVTAKLNLAAKAARELEDRVLQDKALQDRTDRRLLELENASYKAGLSAPLTRDHVHRILFESDETYQVELDKLLAAEVEREKVAQERMRAKIQAEEERKAREKAETERREREAQERAEREREEAERAKAAAVAAPEATQKPSGVEQVEAMRKLMEPAKPEPDTDGMVTWEVTATFATRVKSHVTQAAIEAELRRVMAQAGITALESVTARVRRDAA